MKEGAGVRSFEVGVCPAARVARNSAGEAGTGAVAGVWAMVCTNGSKEKRARRTRTVFFIGHLLVDGLGRKPAVSKEKGALACPG